ncbi:MAG: putative selenium-dependent hydroxylase accessory protein YqeC [Butyricicoccus pullicaecorum]|nr:putative selenium-dependent hydroxylase accessory protein YqeC [Butyricicoccus pullicaecorum]
MSAIRKVAIIGAGGKTTLLRMLSEHHRTKHVLVTTTTHILPFFPPDVERLCIDPQAETLRAALSCSGITCAGTQDGKKLSALSPDLLSLAEQYADYIFYEADGARRMPLKLHTQSEPVILPHTTHGIIVVGLSALGRPISECVHRYTLHPEWSQTPDRPVDAQIIRICIEDAILASKMPAERLTILLNQCDACPQAYASSLASSFQHLHCVFASLQKDGLPAPLSAL